MEILAAMLADAADVFNGKLYVHGGGWDALFAQQFPTVHPAMTLALLLSADSSEAPGTGELRIQLLDEDGNDTGVGAAAGLGLGQGPLHRPGQRTLAPVAIPFIGIRFDRPGGYEFRVSWNGEPLEPGISFSVNLPPQAPPVSRGPADIPGLT